MENREKTDQFIKSLKECGCHTKLDAQKKEVIRCKIIEVNETKAVSQNPEEFSPTFGVAK